MNEEKKQEYFVKSALKSRGWSDKLIETILGEPDKLKCNPFYRSAPEMKLYLIEKVLKYEETEQFKEHLIKREKRVQSAKKAVQTKYNNNINVANQLTFKVPIISKDELIKDAIMSLNCFRGTNIKVNKLSEKSLHRILVNYIRHELTEYDYALYDINGKVGKYELYEIIKNKVLKEISKKYVYLKDECNRQMI